jgi:hypothetical protein
MINFIPVLSAGRSGTHKLYKLLDGMDKLYAEHEGDPGFHTVRKSDDSVKEKFVSDKITFYESTGKQNVLHTGHILSLGFLETVEKSVFIKDCIVLYRPWREIATSMFVLDWIPYKQKIITPWYCGPDEADVLQYDGYETAHPYQLCYWWCMESDRRIKQQTQDLENKGCTIHHYTIKDLLQLDTMNELLGKLGLGSIQTIDDSLSNQRKILEKNPALNRIVPPDSYLDGLEEEVRAKTGYMGH